MNLDIVNMKLDGLLKYILEYISEIQGKFEYYTTAEFQNSFPKETFYASRKYPGKYSSTKCDIYFTNVFNFPKNQFIWQVIIPEAAIIKRYKTTFYTNCFILEKKLN